MKAASPERSTTEANTAVGSPLLVFVCYDHDDASALRQLVRHLAPLERSGSITIWHDGKLLVGEATEDVVKNRLEAADLIILLVTASFLASPRAYDGEAARALERHDARDATVLPVIVSPCDWQSTPISRLHTLPLDGPSIASSADPDAAWLAVATGVRQAATAIRASRSTPALERGAADTPRPLSDASIATRRRRPARRRGTLAVLLAGIVLSLSAGMVLLLRSRLGMSQPSYRGTLRDLTTGQPVADVTVVLIGTSCSTSTDAFGVFSFDGCDDEAVRRLANPRMSISMGGAPSASPWDCQDIPLFQPPKVTELKFDRQRCMTAAPLLSGQPSSPIVSTRAPDFTPVTSSPPLGRDAPRGAEDPPGGTAGRAFDTIAATRALNAAATTAKACKRSGGPTGTTSVRLVWAPSGEVTSAHVQATSFSDTPVGRCIAAAFRGARVPPFDGASIEVTKTVHIE